MIMNAFKKMTGLAMLAAVLMATGCASDVKLEDKAAPVENRSPLGANGGASANGAGQSQVASVDLTGRIMQVGRGMIQGVSHQLFLQFVSAAQAQLEQASGRASAAGEATAASAAPPQQQAIRILPLLLAVFRSAILRFFQRLRRRPSV